MRAYIKPARRRVRDESVLLAARPAGDGGRQQQRLRPRTMFIISIAMAIIIIALITTSMRIIIFSNDIILNVVTYNAATSVSERAVRPGMGSEPMWSHAAAVAAPRRAHVQRRQQRL